MRKTMKKLLTILGACLILATTPLLADGGEKGDVEIGLYTGYGWPDSYHQSNPKDDFLIGGRAGKFVTANWSFELAFQRLKTRTAFDPALGLSDADVNLDALRLNLLYNFCEGKTFRPFATAGLGWEKYDAGSAGAGKDVGYNIGGGVRWFLTDKFGLRFDARLVSVDVGGDINERQNNLEAMLGAVWAVGKGDAPKRVADSDGDGVPDKKDKCPGTPAGARVNEKGCPTDSDGDGVWDGIDQCPDTPSGWKVDEKGCPLDSDGDGVPDATDACPDTPRGAKVDEKGCPLDSDGDGVFDGLDRCPDTPAGVQVDPGGCPLDSDGDGVPDSRDKCPGTPRGTQVDADGCPPPPKAAPLFEGAKKELVLEGVNFETDKAILTPESSAVLDRVAASMHDWPEVRVEIGGHTDSQGRAAHNQKLSEKRAQAVKDYLAGKGIDPGRMTVKGYGMKSPIADNKTKEGRARNRRVDLIRLD
jgi:OOP family OmpA-OmpF porin